MKKPQLHTHYVDAADYDSVSEDDGHSEEYGLHYGFLTAEDEVRSRIAGSFVQRNGADTILKPRISKADAQKLEAMREPEVEGAMDKLLALVPGVPEQVLQLFRRDHKVVHDAHGEYVVTTRYDDFYTVDEGAAQTVEPAVDVSGRKISKKLRLAQILTDHTLSEAKYALTGRQMASVRRATLTGASVAAKLAQDFMNSNQTEIAVRVIPGHPALETPLAECQIAAMASALRQPDFDCLVIGDRVIVYIDRDDDTAPQLAGPVTAMAALMKTATLVHQFGPHIISVLLSAALVRLDIDISDGESCASSPGVFHVASPESGGFAPYCDTSAFFSADQRAKLASAARRVLPVREGGQAVASAVRVSANRVLANAHVIDTYDSAEVDGKGPGEWTHSLQLSADMWALEMDGEQTAWNLRSPVLDEMAVLCYHDGDSVRISEPVKVVRVTGHSIVLTLAQGIKQGCSGAAIVALSDMSLLGIHSSATRLNLLGVVFGSEQFRVMMASDTVSSIGGDSPQQDDSYSAKVLSGYARRGLSPLIASVVGAVTPVYYAGKHIGTAANIGGDVLTTCDAEQPLTWGVARVATMFKPIVHGAQYQAVGGVHALDSPLVRRSCELGEAAHVIAADDVGPYVSAQMGVLHVSPTTKNFLLRVSEATDKPLLGGLIVARDGAVIGQCGAMVRDRTFGLCFKCYPLPEAKVDTVLTDPVAVVSRVFPYLHVAAWPVGVLNEVFTHSSVGVYKDRPDELFNAGNKPLANIGDAFAKLVLFEKLYEQRVPHSEYASTVQSLQCNANMTQIAWDKGLAPCVKVGIGTSLSRTSKCYADVLEALVGAVRLYENSDIAERFVVDCGLVGARPDPGLEFGPTFFEKGDDTPRASHFPV